MPIDFNLWVLVIGNAYLQYTIIYVLDGNLFPQQPLQLLHSIAIQWLPITFYLMAGFFRWIESVKSGPKQADVWCGDCFKTSYVPAHNITSAFKSDILYIIWKVSFEM